MSSTHLTSTAITHALGRIVTGKIFDESKEELTPLTRHQLQVGAYLQFTGIAFLYAGLIVCSLTSPMGKFDIGFPLLGTGVVHLAALAVFYAQHHMRKHAVNTCVFTLLLGALTVLGSAIGAST